MLRNNNKIIIAVIVGACIFIGVGGGIMHSMNAGKIKEEQSKQASKSEENLQSEEVSESKENLQSQEDGQDKKEESPAKSEVKEDTTENKSEITASAGSVESTENVASVENAGTVESTEDTESAEDTASTSEATTDTESKSYTSSKNFTKVKGGSDYIKNLNAINSILDNPNLLDGSNLEAKSEVNHEYKLWDGYLNEIYNVIIYNLPNDVKQDLIAKEKKWTKQREWKGKLAADQYKDSTAKEIARSISEAKSTKDRCYELVNTYMDTTE